MMIRHFLVSCICVAVMDFTVLVCSGQLPARPAHNEPEEEVSDELRQKAIDLLKGYDKNLNRLNRFACAIPIERTCEEKRAGVTHSRYWFLHSQDYATNKRRLDEINETFVGIKPDLTESVSPRFLSTIESDTQLSQRQSLRSDQVHTRENDKVTDDEFQQFFLDQALINVWDLPLVGSNELYFGGSHPSRFWKPKPTFAESLTTYRVTAYKEDSKSIMVRYTCPIEKKETSLNMAYDIAFSKSMGLLPIRCTTSFNGAGDWKGVSRVFDTKWISHRLKGTKEVVYLPVQVDSVFSSPPQKPTSREVHEAKIYWAVDEIPDTIFEMSKDKYIDPFAFKEGILTNAINRK